MIEKPWSEKNPTLSSCSKCLPNSGYVISSNHSCYLIGRDSLPFRFEKFIVPKKDANGIEDSGHSNNGFIVVVLLLTKCIKFELKFRLGKDSTG